MKLSVIVPVYNVENYLKNCVESIINQPFSDFELFLINDASPDDSLEAAHALERQDKRITVFDKPHGGLGDTRNFGAKRAHGDYLLFADADDWLGKDTLGTVVEQAENAAADLTVFDFVRENTAENISRFCGLPLDCPTADAAANEKVLTELVGPDSTATPWRSAEMLGSAWRRLYRREWFQQNALEYPDEEKVMLEDMPVSVKAHCLSQKTLFLDTPVYHYRYNPDSLSTRYRANKFQKLLECFKEIESVLRESGIYTPELEQRHLAWLLRNAAHSALVNVFSLANEKSKVQKKDEIKEIISNPVLRRAAQSSYFKNGSASDKIIKHIVKSGSVFEAYQFYSRYAAKLQKNSSGQ